MAFLKKFSILFLILFSVSGCFWSNSDEKYSHKDLKVSLRLPSGWERAYTSPLETVNSMAFEDGRGGEIILVHNYDADFKKQIDIVSEVYYPILQKGELLFSRHKAQWLQSNQDRITNRTYVLQDKNGRVFSLICTVPSINFVPYRSTFDRVAKSFRSF